MGGDVTARAAERELPPGAGAIAAIVLAETGMVLSRTQLAALPGALRRATGSASPDVVLERLAGAGEDGELLWRLIDELVVTETSFGRERRQLDAIDWPALLARAHGAGRDHVRVWSAACSSGEEAFTLAMLGAEALGDPARVSVLGTDVSPRVLDEARAATYGSRALRLLEPELVARWLAPADRVFVVGDALRERVRFAGHNLARDALPPATDIDLVLCRNVLIYFSPEAVVRALAILDAARAPGGTLMLGIADTLCVPRSHRAAGPERPSRGRAPGAPLRLVASRPAADPPPPPRPARSPAAADEEDPARAALAEALAHADADRLDEARACVDVVIREQPMLAEAQFLRGLLCRAAGDERGAVAALRAARYNAPTLALAGFELGRALEAVGDRRAAVSAYEHVLATAAGGGHRWLAERVGVKDVEEACRRRLTALGV